MINFLDIAYLRNGNNKQQKAYHILKSNKVLEKLHSYAPILVGTIPIEIDIKTSDLDIICEMKDELAFTNDLSNFFGAEKAFSISRNDSFKSIKASFMIGGFEVEIFGQHIPTIMQNAYRHMLVEYRILQERGEDFKQEIIKLKAAGYKTEPAFAKLLNLEGDPYEALLRIE